MSASPSNALLREKLFTFSLASKTGLLKALDMNTLPLALPSNFTALNCIMSITYSRLTPCRLTIHESDVVFPILPFIFIYCFPCSNRKSFISMLSLSRLISEGCTFHTVSFSTIWLEFNRMSVCSLPFSLFFENAVTADISPLYVTLVLFPQNAIVERVSLSALAFRLTLTIAPFFMSMFVRTWQCSSSCGFSNSRVVDSYFLSFNFSSGILALI